MQIEKTTLIYALDMDENGFPKFTEKNIAFFNGAARYTSVFTDVADKNDKEGNEYKNAYPGILTEHKEDFFGYAGDGSGNKDELGNPITWLYRVIASIDSMNSTHLSVEGTQKSESGKKQNRGRALTAQKIKEIPDLREPLEKGDPKLVDKIAEAVPGRRNFSFASKFCAYVSNLALGKDNYCIYDEILQSVLPYYAYKYILPDRLGEFPPLYKRIKGIKGKKDRNESLVSEYKNKNYEEYRKLVNAIIEGIENKENVTLSYTDFDRVIWSYFRAAKSRVLRVMDCI